MCADVFEASYFHESKFDSFYSPIRAHSSNKTGFSCFSAAAFASSNVLLCLITVVWKVKVFASFENIMT